MIIRVTREGIYASLTTFAIAGAILVTADLLGKVKDQKWAIYHACFFGLSLACFWLTREEGIWLLPSIGLLIGIGCISFYLQNRSFKALFKQSRKLILSLLITVTCVVGVGLINYAHYGVFLARSEIMSTDFKAAYGALTRVKSTPQNSYLPVSQQVRQQLYDKSEKFRLLQPYLDVNTPENKAWKQVGCSFYSSACGDYAGGWFLWAFRAAVAKAGYANTAPQALTFYRDLATEVNGLCSSNQLECLPPRKGTMPPLNFFTLKAMPQALQNGLKMMVGLSNLKVQSEPSLASSADGLKLFTEWTRTPATSTEAPSCQFKHLEVLGWVNRPGDSFKLFIPPDGGVSTGEYLFTTKLPSPDIVKVFNNPQLAESRFKLNVCCKSCKLSLVGSKNKTLTQIDLIQGSRNGTGIWGTYNFDDVKSIAPELNTLKLKAINLVNIVLYQRLLYYLNILALGLWCLRLLLSLFRVLPWTIVYGLATSILLAILIRVVLLALIDITSFPALTFYYLLPGAVLVPVFTILILADTVIVWRSRRSLNF